MPNSADEGEEVRPSPRSLTGKKVYGRNMCMYEKRGWPNQNLAFHRLNCAVVQKEGLEPETQ
jgi:hypothetical protein